MQPIQEVREEYILKLRNSDNIENKMEELSEDLFSLDLTMYSKYNSFNSILYSSLAESKLDEKIVLHPEQMKIIEEINNNDALIVSAPTSFR